MSLGPPSLTEKPAGRLGSEDGKKENCWAQSLNEGGCTPRPAGAVHIDHAESKPRGQDGANLRSKRNHKKP